MLAIVSRFTTSTSISWETVGLLQVTSKNLVALLWQLAWMTHVTQTTILSSAITIIIWIIDTKLHLGIIFLSSE